MAAEREFGRAIRASSMLSTVAMSHPDGQQALLSGASEITGHFSSRLSSISSSSSRASGACSIPMTFSVDRPRSTWCGRRKNSARKIPRPMPLSRAFDEATKAIQCRQRAPARYSKIANDKKSSVDDIAAMLTTPRSSAHDAEEPDEIRDSCTGGRISRSGKLEGSVLRQPARPAGH